MTLFFAFLLLSTLVPVFLVVLTRFVADIATVVAAEHRLVPGARMSSRSTAIVKTPIGGQ